MEVDYRQVRFVAPVNSDLDPKKDATKFKTFLSVLRGVREVKVFAPRTEGLGRDRRLWVIVEYTGPLFPDELADEKKYPSYYREKEVRL